MFSIQSSVKLVSFDATDGLRLKGVLGIGKDNQATIIHIHGNCGNFYENDFLPVMVEKYTSAGINFLCVNHRGHDVIAEAYRNGKLVYIGGAYEIFEEFIHDIEGAIQFAQQLGNKIILQGHSFGCLKTLAYLINTSQELDFILLSPSNTYHLQSNYIYPQILEDQLHRIINEWSDRPDSLLPFDEFGIKQGNVIYHIPISARTFISLFNSSLPYILRYDTPIPYYLNTRGLVYYGGKDALWTEDREVVERFFLQRVKSLQFQYVAEGDHHFHGLESVVADGIIKWVKETEV